MSRLCTFIAAMAMAAALCAPAAAEDLNPPSWRGNPNTSWVQWEFDDPGDFVAFPAYPDYNDGFLPFGEPVLEHTPGPGAGWHEKQPTAEFSTYIYDPAGVVGDGWLNLSGEIIIELQNDPTPRPTKQIWLQFVWEPQSPGNVPLVQLLDPLGAPSTIPLVRQELWSDDPANTWRTVYHDTWHLQITPNPEYEVISISGGINVDEVVVDTWCVPEPATMALVGIGIAGMVVRRKR